MRVEIVGHHLPGMSCGARPEGGTYENIHVGIGSRGQGVELVRGDADAATWQVEVTVVPLDDGALDFRGPFVDGRRGDRFIYLNWGTVDGDTFEMFRRAKLGLSDLDPGLINRAVAAGHLRARVHLTDGAGHPRCARVHPPDIAWDVPPAS